MDEAAFSMLLKTSWMQTPAAIVSLIVPSISLVTICIAACIDRRQQIPRHEHEALLLSSLLAEDFHPALVILSQALFVSCGKCSG